MKTKENYWTNEHYQLMNEQPWQGDEIEFDGRNWIIHRFNHHMGSQRDYDTILHTEVGLLSVDTDADGNRDIRWLNVFPKWNVVGKNKTEFIYTMIKKKAWGQVWVKLSE